MSISQENDELINDICKRKNLHYLRAKVKVDLAS